MLVQMNVQFNRDIKSVVGIAIAEKGNCYVVDFEHGGVEFRGLWPKASCKI